MCEFLICLAKSGLELGISRAKPKKGKGSWEVKRWKNPWLQKKVLWRFPKKLPLLLEHQNNSSFLMEAFDVYLTTL